MMIAVIPTGMDPNASHRICDSGRRPQLMIAATAAKENVDGYFRNRIER